MPSSLDPRPQSRGTAERVGKLSAAMARFLRQNTRPRRARHTPPSCDAMAAVISRCQRAPPRTADICRPTPGPWLPTGWFRLSFHGGSGSPCSPGSTWTTSSADRDLDGPCWSASTSHRLIDRIDSTRSCNGSTWAALVGPGRRERTRIYGSTSIDRDASTCPGSSSVCGVADVVERARRRRNHPLSLDRGYSRLPHLDRGLLPRLPMAGFGARFAARRSAGAVRRSVHPSRCVGSPPLFGSTVKE